MKSVEEYIKKGTPLMMGGKLEEAEEAFQKAIEIAPDDYTGWFHLSLVLFIGGRFTEAIEVWVKADKLRAASDSEQG